MTDPISPERIDISVARADAPSDSGSFAQRIRLAVRVVQVRLRFVAVLVAAFLVVGLWGNLRNVWDTVAHRLMGGHVGQHAVSGDTEYWCPMDPGVVSDWPAICPVCNMDLVRRKKGEAVVLPEGLVARMQFSPYRIQLAGIRTSVVKRQSLAREIVLAGRLAAIPARPPADQSDSPAAPQAPPGQSFILECEAYASDLALLISGRTAEVAIEGFSAVPPLTGRIVPDRSDAPPARRPPTVRIRLDSAPIPLRAGMYGTARVAVPLSEMEPFASQPVSTKTAEPSEFVAVPETAVVDTGNHRVVFVETMPGMFDGVEVTLGPRCGDFFPVLVGLEPGQRVATVGAFLIDAEARLSRNVAASYFGAARSTGSDPAGGDPAGADARAVEIPKSKKPVVSKLSAADQQLARQQKTCPVTGAPLDSMGGPLAVEIQGRRVFICCKGCEAPLKKDPEKYLAKLKHD
jgi:Cu(I)/Ag(I) efflux system membrane fusion protein